MPLDSTALDAELRRLRKGAAMRHPQLLTRLGPQVRLAFGISPRDDAWAARGKVAGAVRALLGNRSADLQTAALAALGLAPETDQRRLSDRQEWLAGRLFCDVRTARRRMDEAFTELVDAILEDNARRCRITSPDDGWAVRRFRATLRLDRPGPELYEQRTIQVTAGARDRIVCRLSVPRACDGREQPDVSARATYGGKIVEATRVSPEHFQFTLALPRLLRQGETHDYGIVFVLPPGQPMRSHYVYQPLLSCDEFELIVRFAPAAPPEQVWRLVGLPIRVVDGADAGRDALPLDENFAVQLAFRDPRQGLAYGVKWTPKVQS